jgi:hypothetical protein
LAISSPCRSKIGPISPASKAPSLWLGRLKEAGPAEASAVRRQSFLRQMALRLVTPAALTMNRSVDWRAGRGRRLNIRVLSRIWRRGSAEAFHPRQKVRKPPAPRQLAFGGAAGAARTQGGGNHHGGPDWRALPPVQRRAKPALARRLRPAPRPLMGPSTVRSNSAMRARATFFLRRLAIADHAASRPQACQSSMRC